VGQIKLALQAGKANPAPPVGPALGSKARALFARVAARALCSRGALTRLLHAAFGEQGVNIMAFCKEYNAKTADKVGQIIPVAITVYDDKSFTLELKTPPASFLLKEKAGIKAGSAKGQKVKVGKVTAAQVSEIAQIKMRDLNCGGNLESGVAIIKGTARNMGIDVVG
jgi:large subunit ribosomal protein L11